MNTLNTLSSVFPVVLFWIRVLNYLISLFVFFCSLDVLTTILQVLLPSFELFISNAAVESCCEYDCFKSWVDCGVGRNS